MSTVRNFFVSVEFVPVGACCHEGCGIQFALTLDLKNKRLQDGKGFYCPNGHLQFYQDNENARLKKQLEQKQKDVEWIRAQRDRAERQTSAARGLVTKIKNKIANGVCPCCKRSFINLHRHMKHMHPTFKTDKE